ncbi:MAG: hypothetical protein LBC84_01445 [Prevotellaceae bacterium]|jgi:hypothetical protein|nr:hypothetical protein [Prevotellaceae bacterium]
MKTNYKTIFAAIILTLFCVSCGGGGGATLTVDSALKQMEKAMDKVEKNKDAMTEADWTALAEELEAPFKMLNEAIEKEEVGVMKMLQISAVLMRYSLVFAEAGLNTFGSSFQEAMEGFQFNWGDGDDDDDDADDDADDDFEE